MEKFNVVAVENCTDKFFDWKTSLPVQKVDVKEDKSKAEHLV